MIPQFLPVSFQYGTKGMAWFVQRLRVPLVSPASSHGNVRPGRKPPLAAPGRGKRDESKDFEAAQGRGAGRKK